MRKSFIKTSLTEADNESFDIFRISLALAMLAFIVLAAYTTFHTGSFDMIGYGTGFGALLGGGGIGIGVRAKMEPPFSAKPGCEGEGEGEGQ